MALPPRAVFLTRRSEYDELIAAHATLGQARFFLEQRGQQIEHLIDRHEVQAAALARAIATLPDEWRQARVERGELDRFLFTPDDVVVAVGQDGLVANVAKYLDGQPVLGVNPAPDEIEGVLVPLRLDDLAELMPAAAAGAAALERRVMAEARLDDGQRMIALNEIFIGHQSHQSARYSIRASKREEVQSSSGIVVSTGTGATGWARSLMALAGVDLPLSPEAPELGFFVREPWPSRATGTDIRHGTIKHGKHIAIRSRMNQDGVIFADGIEADRIRFGWGRLVEVGVSKRVLNLIQPV